MLEEIDERGGNASVLAGTARDHRYHYAPAQTWQNVSRESANNRFLVEGRKRDECLTTEQTVRGNRSPADVGSRWLRLELTTEKDRAALMDLTWSGPSLHANDAHT